MQTIKCSFLPTVVVTALFFSILFGACSSSDDPPPSPPPETAAPEIAALSHPDGAAIEPLTVLRFSAIDADGDMDAATLVVRINGVEQNNITVFSDNQIVMTPTADTPWPNCAMVVTVSISDAKGHSVDAQFKYMVTPCSAFQALPETGDAPLAVRFIPQVVTDNAIENYEWDFDGDGAYDVADPVGRNQVFQYDTPGDYTVTLRITDNRGEQSLATATVRVANAPPSITAEASPSNGQAPLNVRLTVVATDNEGIAEYAWDFEGDGVFDYQSGNAAQVRHTYEKAGVYKPVVRVTDTLGLSSIYSELTTEVRAGPEGSPSVTINAQPQTGPVPLIVAFSAPATCPGSAVVKWEWDFDGDGRFEQSLEGRTAEFTYQSAGTYYARTRVTAENGRTAEDFVEITVQQNLSLSVSTDTIDTGLSESTVIKTMLGGITRVCLQIEDAAAVPVKMLAPWTDRPAGTYEDIWTGDDENSGIVKEGVYYAVLLYENEGRTERLDLALTSGGKEFAPSRTSIPPKFSPFAGEPLQIDFTLQNAAEITAFVGQYETDTRWLTFMQRKPLGKGTHRITWNGVDSNGQIRHPPQGDQFLFGMFGYTLPDNAVYVRSGAHINDLQVAPSIYNPSEIQADGSERRSRLTFDLSRGATVELTVADAGSGKTIARRKYAALPKGANTITWDGTTDDGIMAAPGSYRLGVTAIDANAFRSTTLYILQRIYY